MNLNGIGTFKPPVLAAAVCVGADDNAYVVKVYPLAVAVCLVELAITAAHDRGLTGVWWGLWIYYLVLLLGFAHRFWFRRNKL